MSRPSRLSSVLSLLLVLALCITVFSSVPAGSMASNPINVGFHSGRVPKYVFLFIGDGMSYAQVSTAEMFLGNRADPGAVIPEQLNFTKFPVHGALMTQDSTSFIPDSASTATSLASGFKTLSAVINMDETKTVAYTPFTYDLKRLWGRKIGIITSVPIDHATPAAFYAAVPGRWQVDSIAQQLAASGFDFFGGGGFQGNAAQVQKSISYAVDAGYAFVNTREGIRALNANSGKVLAISPDLDGAALNYELDRDRAGGELSLADFVSKGIDVLNNRNGFFMMVESGKIDWANHANDVAASIHDTIAFADAIEVALEFYHSNPRDTLILVTADHECGGLTIGFAGTGYSTFFEVIEPVTMSYVEFGKVVASYKTNTPAANADLTQLLPAIKSAYGLLHAGDPNATSQPRMVLTGHELERLQAALVRSYTAHRWNDLDDQEKLLYGGYEPLTVTLTHISANKAGLAFTSYHHTGLPVPVYALGVGAELFDGFYDNTGIYHRIVEVTKILRGLARKPAA